MERPNESGLRDFYMTTPRTDHARLLSSDRMALLCMALLLMSPIIFKVQLAANLIMHPLSILLAAAWSYAAVVGLSFVKSAPRIPAAPRMLAIPLFLMGVMMGAQLVSLTLNTLLRHSWQSAGWLLLVKQALYLAPLPFAALLVFRMQHRMIQLLSYAIPLVALLTLAYSGIRLFQSSHGYLCELTL